MSRVIRNRDISLVNGGTISVPSFHLDGRPATEAEWDAFMQTHPFPQGGGPYSMSADWRGKGMDDFEQSSIIARLFDYVNHVFPEGVEFDRRGPESPYSRKYRGKLLEDGQRLLKERGHGNFKVHDPAPARGIDGTVEGGDDDDT